MANGFISFSLILPLSKFIKTEVTQIKSFYFQDVIGLHLRSPRETSSANIFGIVVETKMNEKYSLGE
jgi:hypothetical protein